MAVAPGEGLGGPQSRPGRTRPPDSQQVHSGDSGHSSRVGSRTHCLGLDRLGQVAAPPTWAASHVWCRCIPSCTSLEQRADLREHQPGEDRRGASHDGVALGAGGCNTCCGAGRDCAGEAGQHSYAAPQLRPAPADERHSHQLPCMLSKSFRCVSLDIGERGAS